MLWNLWRVGYFNTKNYVYLLACMLWKGYCFNVMIIKVNKLVHLESRIWVHEASCINWNAKIYAWRVKCCWKIEEVICLIALDYKYLWMKKWIHHHDKISLNWRTYAKTYLCYFTCIMMSKVQVYVSLVENFTSKVKCMVLIHGVKDVEEKKWWSKVSGNTKSLMSIQS